MYAVEDGIRNRYLKIAANSRAADPQMARGGCGVKAARHQIRPVVPWEIGHLQSTATTAQEGMAEGEDVKPE